MSNAHVSLLAILDAIEKVERYSNKFNDDDDPKLKKQILSLMQA